ncbi:hypothetical protein GCM10010124_10780 [Pilimelia terevasa]|uniref:Uncharacterized protein n=1 Tax=Pilimelia terevasa TaxID=53372 RepID=A0A8J3FIP1_9ACTN|nr:hypothetical protein [Pilimelia terevasa]GGK20029.1 hypothetical protein GCM10010124_10780 [Pilimelia terevasa]
MIGRFRSRPARAAVVAAPPAHAVPGAPRCAESGVSERGGPGTAAGPGVSECGGPAAREVAAAFARYDRVTLAAVTPHLRAGQLAARWDLWMFVERVWDDARQRGDDPAADPRYAAVGALRDLVCSLYESADEAQRLAGDVDY